MRTVRLDRSVCPAQRRHSPSCTVEYVGSECYHNLHVNSGGKLQQPWPYHSAIWHLNWGHWWRILNYNQAKKRSTSGIGVQLWWSCSFLSRSWPHSACATWDGYSRWNHNGIAVIVLLGDPRRCHADEKSTPHHLLAVKLAKWKKSRRYSIV